MDLKVDMGTLVTTTPARAKIFLSGKREDGHTVVLIIDTTDVEDLGRFPIGMECTLTVDRKIGEPSMGA